MTLIETVLEKPYTAAKTFVRGAILSESVPDRSKEKLQDNCTIPATTYISPGSTLIIGHAYGAPKGAGEFISEAAEKFILKHAASLDGVIFSGDVFKLPSVKKWKKLEALSDKTATKFYVAPGNHDVGFGDNPSRDVWNLSGHSLKDNAVKHISLSGFNVLLEDSVIANWQLTPTVLKALNGFVSNDPVLLVRHHIAVKEMLPIANSQAGFLAELPSLSDLSSKIPTGVTIISGDSGAFSRLPRIACLKDKKVTVIASGIGDVKGDMALVLHEGQISQISL